MSCALVPVKVQVQVRKQQQRQRQKASDRQWQQDVPRDCEESLCRRWSGRVVRVPGCPACLPVILERSCLPRSSSRSTARPNLIKTPGFPPQSIPPAASTSSLPSSLPDFSSSSSCLHLSPPSPNSGSFKQLPPVPRTARKKDRPSVRLSAYSPLTSLGLFSVLLLSSVPLSLFPVIPSLPPF